MSWRRFGRLLNRLPRKSRTVQAVGGDRVRWGPEEHLLAGVYDAVTLLASLYQRVHWKSPPQWKPLPRPGEVGPERRLGGKKSYTRGQVDRILARMKPKGVTDG